jgi:hypothetical protein
MQDVLGKRHSICIRIDPGSILDRFWIDTDIPGS